MADVFVSYASEDRERVRPLAEALLQRGVAVWWDRALAAGDDYASVIARELEAAKAVVVVWSATSVASPWVRDEAGRARDAGRLVPAMIDPVEIPLGFGQLHTEDLTAWNGAPGAPQIDLLADALAARIAGATVDSQAFAAKRARLMTRVRVVSVLGAVASVVAIVAGVVTIARGPAPSAPPAAAPPGAGQTQLDPLAQLLRLVDEGKITGEQAVRLAELLQQQAFSDVAPTAPQAGAHVQGGAGAGSAALRTSLAPEAAAAVETASLGFDSAARETYAEAVVQLIQDPDARVRAAVLKASRPQSRAEGVDALLAIAAEGGPAAGAIFRACGALLSAVDDPRARDTLEKAQHLNPQDMRLWRLLSVMYVRDRRPLDAAGAALVGEGLDAAAQGKREEAARTLETALSFVARDPESKAFVLGQLGDAAAARSDWNMAERRYAEAVRLHGAVRDAGALSVEAAKLARAHLAQGETREACRILRKAEEAGAAVSEQEMGAACRPEATGGVGPPGPLRITPPRPAPDPPPG